MVIGLASRKSNALKIARGKTPIATINTIC